MSRLRPFAVRPRCRWACASRLSRFWLCCPPAALPRARWWSIDPVRSAAQAEAARRRRTAGACTSCSAATPSTASPSATAWSTVRSQPGTVSASPTRSIPASDCGCLRRVRRWRRLDRVPRRMPAQAALCRAVRDPLRLRHRQRAAPRAGRQVPPRLRPWHPPRHRRRRHPEHRLRLHRSTPLRLPDPRHRHPAARCAGSGRHRGRSLGASFPAIRRVRA